LQGGSGQFHVAKPSLNKQNYNTNYVAGATESSSTGKSIKSRDKRLMVFILRFFFGKSFYLEVPRLVLVVYLVWPVT